MAEKNKKNTTSLFIADTWADYALLDSGNEKKLERFGKYRLVRPELQAMWRSHLSDRGAWNTADAIFRGGDEESGWRWQCAPSLPQRWSMRWRDTSFFVSPTAFRHTGVFPEQASQWEWIDKQIIGGNSTIKVLNLFGHTGIASLVAARAGAEVTHLDASSKIITWAKENQKLSGLQNAPIRWIVNDALKFVRREARRGATYDGFIIDPPKFGRGAQGEVWKIYEHLPVLLDECQKLFSDDLSFIILTAYAIRITPLTLRYLLEERLLDRGGIMEDGALALREESRGHILPQAVCARWSKEVV